MRKASLFSGIGGIDLAAHWAGMETVVFCEREPFPQSVLRKHWPGVPIIDDVRNFTRKELERLGIGAIDIISAGYPCQPYSLAGDRGGADDDRALWPEVKRILQEIKPEWFVGENVAGHITLGLDEVLSDLESIGYTWETFVIPAIAVNAPHRRDRVFIVGHLSDTGGIGYQGNERLREDKEKIREWRTRPFRPASKLFDDVDWKERASESGFLGRNDVVPNRLDRIKALGNAVAPAQIYPILAAIKQIDDWLKDAG